ncbi:MAG: asparagine synthetase B, partial [Alphaproteobacteria bacterium]
PWSIHENIFKLPPAGMLELPLDGSPPLDALPEPRIWWRHPLLVPPGERSLLPAEEEEKSVLDRLEDLLRKAVAERMIADVPLGAFLSGGIDSSLVVALMREHARAPVKTFSIGFREADHDEAPFARRVARHLGTDHRELYVTPDEARSVIPELARIHDEPFADSSQIPTTLVARLARTEVTVALSGDGGDEAFCGYHRYLWGEEVAQRTGRVPLALRRLAAGTIRCLPRASAALLRLIAGLSITPLGRTRSPHRLLVTAELLAAETPGEWYDALTLYWPRHSTTLAGEMPLPPHWRAIRGGRRRPLAEFLMAADSIGYLPNDILTKVDRAAMSCSLETRIPFLDPAVQDFAARIPHRMRVRDGRGKWPLRALLARHLPRTLFDRPKQGFAVPIAAWLRGPLREWAGDLISPDRLHREGLIEAKTIAALWDEHQRGEEDWSPILWAAAMFEAWREESANDPL